MKSKATLSLMEQILMVLVFAITAAICLKVFVYSDNTSKNIEATDQAYLMAQTAAATIKNSAGAELENGKYELSQDGLYLIATEEAESNSYLGSALIQVTDEDQNLLCELPVKWQK